VKIVRLGRYIVNLSEFDSYRLIRKLILYSNLGVGNILDKDSSLRINLNLDGVPVTSKSHTHPSHS
jgi:hypothetical protein